MKKQTNKYFILLLTSIFIFFLTLIGTKIYNNIRCYNNLQNYLLSYSNIIDRYIDDSYEDEYKELITRSTSALKNKDYSNIASAKKDLINFKYDLMNSYNEKVLTYIDDLKSSIIPTMDYSDKESLKNEFDSLYECSTIYDANAEYERLTKVLNNKNKEFALKRIDEYNEFINSNKDILLSDKYYENVYLKMCDNISSINTCISNNDYSSIKSYINQCDKAISSFKQNKI